MSPNKIVFNTNLQFFSSGLIYIPFCNYKKNTFRIVILTEVFPSQYSTISWWYGANIKTKMHLFSYKLTKFNHKKVNFVWHFIAILKTILHSISYNTYNWLVSVFSFIWRYVFCNSEIVSCIFLIWKLKIF
jgi:hypothetical protein